MKYRIINGLWSIASLALLLMFSPSIGRDLVRRTRETEYPNV